MVVVRTLTLSTGLSIFINLEGSSYRRRTKPMHAKDQDELLPMTICFDKCQMQSLGRKRCVLYPLHYVDWQNPRLTPFSSSLMWDFWLKFTCLSEDYETHNLWDGAKGDEFSVDVVRRITIRYFILRAEFIFDFAADAKEHRWDCEGGESWNAYSTIERGWAYPFRLR